MSKAARKRRRLERERLLALPHSGCADADLAVLDNLLEAATELLEHIATETTASRASWPDAAEAGELRAILEETSVATTACVARLAAARERARRFGASGRHLHVVDGRVVRMVIEEPTATAPVATAPSSAKPSKPTSKASGTLRLRIHHTDGVEPEEDIPF